ncbi:MAG: transcriptional regulator [Bacteroidales bacterium]|nr:transcriptional regulator [Bacteroidales bacterium]
MIEQAKFESILRLLIQLSGPYGRTIDGLAGEMGKSARTIRRYIQTLRDCGFVVESNESYFRIVEFEKGRKLSDLLHFSAEESELLSRAIHSIDFDGALKESLTQKLFSLYNNKLVPYAIVTPEKSENIVALCEAIRQKKQVRLIDYSSAHSSSTTTRLVEPFDFTVNYVQLWAYEPESASNKYFKIARIRSVEILDRGWQFEAKHQTAFTDIFRMSGPEQIPVKLKLSMRAATLLQEEYPLSGQFLTQNAHAEWILETTVCSFEGVGRFVMGLLNEVEVLQPGSLEGFIETKLSSFRKNYLSQVIINSG